MTIVSADEPSSIRTRPSLISALKKANSVEGWNDFYAIYGRVVRDFALKAGLSETEAGEVVQETAIGVARNLPQYRYDPKVCRFKTWLLNFASWRVRDQLRKRKRESNCVGDRPLMADDESGPSLLDSLPAPSDELGVLFESEWQQALLKGALENMKGKFTSKQIQIFDLFVLQEWPASEVARALGVTVANVYVTRHRISHSLKRERRRLEDEIEKQAGADSWKTTAGVGSYCWSWAILLLLAASSVVEAESILATNDGTISIILYEDTTGAINIPAEINGLPVTTIGSMAFTHYQPDNVRSVTMPDTLVSIGYGAFSNCENLTNVVIGKGVKSIESYAFAGTALTTFEVGPGVTNLGHFGSSKLININVDSANPVYSSVAGVLFNKGQTQLIECPGGRRGSYGIPEGVLSIGGGAFDHCWYIGNVTMPQSLTDIGDWAFEGLGLTNITIGNSVTNIGEGAFADCILTNVAFPNTTITIGSSAFANCGSLNSVALPPNLVRIGDGAFSRSGLTEIKVPASVSSLGGGAFSYCLNLTSAILGEGLPGIPGLAFAGCSSLVSVSIPKTVTTIGAAAFDRCSSLTNVTLPEGLLSIEDGLHGKEEGPHGAFAQCPLISVEIPSGVTNIGSFAFASCTTLTNVTLGKGAARIGEEAFWKCWNLTQITIPAGASLDVRAFAGSSLTSVTIPNGVTSIPFLAFSDCPDLSTVAIGDDVTNIESYAFVNCSALATVTIGKRVAQIGEGAFMDCGSLTAVFFRGNAPIADPTAFESDSATIYYLPGANGWSNPFDGRPTLPWFAPQPVILNPGLGLGPESSRLQFTVSWAAGAPVVVESATDLLHPIWTAASTNALMEGASYYNELVLINHSQRFYRLRAP